MIYEILMMLLYLGIIFAGFVVVGAIMYWYVWHIDFKADLDDDILDFTDKNE